MSTSSTSSMLDVLAIPALTANIRLASVIIYVLIQHINQLFLVWIGEKITIRTLRYITSVANEREYSVPSAVLRVVKVFKWDSSFGNYLSVTDMGATHRPGTGEGSEYYHFPSTWTIDMMKKIRGLSRVRHEFDPINRKLRIDPYPEEAGTKYYYISADKSKWTLDDLPQDFEELVAMGCTWKCTEQIAMKRSELGGVMREGGRVSYPASELWAIARDMKEDFYNELDTKSMIYSR
jgi:hypothetical protein